MIGQSIGRYHILEQLGQGGMATVYIAFDTHVEREVAIKFIRGEKLTGKNAETVLKRFKREAQALAKLSHPNILTVLDYGEHEGQLFLVTEYLPGGSLKQKLGKPVHWAEAAKLLAPIARALEYAHSQRILHRDVKPANILLSPSGLPVLADFGIAKLLEGEETTELTRADVGIGTPEYMAPEQGKGKADPRSDIYSLGVVFYELIAGRKPYTADTPLAVLMMHATDPLPRPKQFVRDLPDSVERVIFKALAKKAEDRYQSMGEFAGALERVAQGKKAPAPGETLRHLLVPASAILVLLTLAAGGFFAVRGMAGPSAFNQQTVVPVVTQISATPRVIQITTTPLPTTTPTVTPMPTATKVFPTTIPLDVAGQEDIYDTFDNPVHDGAFDRSLWQTRYGVSPRPFQANGRLVFAGDKIAATDQEVALEAFGLGLIEVDSVRYIEAELGLGSDANRQFSHVAINVVVYGSGWEWWAEANLINNGNHPALLCKVAFYGNRELEEFSYTYDHGMKYDQWYTVRIEIDSETLALRWILDGVSVAEYMPKEPNDLRNRSAMLLLNSFRSSGSKASTYVDNVRVGK